MDNNTEQPAQKIQTTSTTKMVVLGDMSCLMTLEVEQNAHGFELCASQITQANEEPLMIVMDKMACVCKPDCPMH